MISHSSTEQNMCTQTHPNGHAHKSCQITLVHTHGHVQEALRRSSLYNPDIGKHISARCTSAVPEAGAEPAPATVRVIRCHAGNVATWNAWELADAQGTVEKISASASEVAGSRTK